MSYTFFLKFNLKRDIKNKHIESLYLNCHKCNEFFKTHDQLKEHIKKCNLKCYNCYTYFSRAYNLRCHFKTCIKNDKENLDIDIVNNLIEKTQKYNLLIEKGMKISKVLENRSDILKAALDNDDKRALE